MDLHGGPFGVARTEAVDLYGSYASYPALLAARGTPTYWTLAVFVTAMAFGVAFTDVLTDAMMVESGKPLGLTGAFQSVQWAGISVATILGPASSSRPGRR